MRRFLAALCLGVGISAIGGGVPLLIRPDGSLYGMPLSLLDHSPFVTFLIPGLLLVFVIGVGTTLAGAQVLRGSPRANVMAFAAGVALLTWIVVEMVLLRAAHWLQLGYLAVAVLIIAVALGRTLFALITFAIPRPGTAG